MFIFGECDCCGAATRLLHRGEPTGVEAYACSECRHIDPKDEAHEIEEELDACEADPNRHGDGDHRRALIANMKAELARVNQSKSGGN